MNIALDTLDDSAVIDLLRDHLTDMYATSPPESVHALDVDAIKGDAITFWVAREGARVLGCIALKALDDAHGEVKSMRTAPAERNRGVGGRLLEHLIEQAKDRGYRRLSLETGSMEFFEPARRLYTRYGFEYCAPFAAYKLDPNSVFMTRLI